MPINVMIYYYKIYVSSNVSCALSSTVSGSVSFLHILFPAMIYCNTAMFDIHLLLKVLLKKNQKITDRMSCYFKMLKASAVFNAEQHHN